MKLTWPCIRNVEPLSLMTIIICDWYVACGGTELRFENQNRLSELGNYVDLQ